MFIVHPKGAYVRPHKHLDRIESMLVIDGEVDYIMFDDNGKIDNAIKSINLAAKSGASAVKFQLFKTDEFMSQKKIYNTS